jgi:predicted transcriptional regulator
MSGRQEEFTTLAKSGQIRNPYKQIDKDSHTLASVLSSVYENKSFSLFYAIAITNMPDAAADGPPNAEILISRMNLTRKQYYSRIKRLLEAGLIRRKGSRLVLTSLGKIVYETHKTIGFAIHNRWKLQAIDLLDTSLSAEGMPPEERDKLIKALLGDHRFTKDIVRQAK